MLKYERDAILIERANDLENIVKDKREIWKFKPSKLLEDKEDTKQGLSMSF